MLTLSLLRGITKPNFPSDPNWNLNDWKELSRKDCKDLNQNIEYSFLEYVRT